MKDRGVSGSFRRWTVSGVESDADQPTTWGEAGESSIRPWFRELKGAKRKDMTIDGLAALVPGDSSENN